jgi:hypothetical protein
MKLKVYRIDRTLLGKLGRKLKEPDLPPSAGMLGGGLIGHLLQTVHDVRTDDFYILSDDAEISRFRDPTHQPLRDGVYYVRNPREAYTRELVVASDFHHWILKQQATEMLDFIRGNLQATRIEFQLENSAGAQVDFSASFPTDAGPLPVAAGARSHAAAKHRVVVDCERPLKASEKRTTYGWINDFPQLLSAVDAASSRGTLSVIEEFDYSFGLSGKVADLMGMSASWLCKHTWKLDVTMG